MKQSELNNKASSYVDSYEVIKSLSSTFEPKGIFHSELLMAYTLIKELGVEKVIESGRARGQSTEIIARICQQDGLEFHSIEYDDKSPDVAVAEKRLAPYKDVCTLHYGDGFELMPKLLDGKDTLIIIDGPKGVWAQKLGLLMLKKENVKAVLFHDTHRDAYDSRPRLERYFGRHLLVSDDYEYVDAFSYLDDVCWQETNKFFDGYAPYKRYNTIMRSYAGTLSCVINNNIDETMLDNYINDINRSILVKESLLFRLANKINLISMIKNLHWKLT
ncbi:class I SAM-dependent methyltransferase [Motiliproteus sediminis]|uniref:class I SAM-dependent methyltransferase n=1 Tax=Motiliproteus sediminis TaxID=1468178 RepID=UPI001AEF82D6|nr:class I SAM-dependent methyltransferase [Motiliproteus sediminis]